MISFFIVSLCEFLGLVKKLILIYCHFHFREFELWWSDVVSSRLLRRQYDHVDVAISLNIGTVLSLFPNIFSEENQYYGGGFNFNYTKGKVFGSDFILGFWFSD